MLKLDNSWQVGEAGHFLLGVTSREIASEIGECVREEENDLYDQFCMTNSLFYWFLQFLDNAQSIQFLITFILLSHADKPVVITGYGDMACLSVNRSFHCKVTINEANYCKTLYLHCKVTLLLLLSANFKYWQSQHMLFCRCILETICQLWDNLPTLGRNLCDGNQTVGRWTKNGIADQYISSWQTITVPTGCTSRGRMWEAGRMQMESYGTGDRISGCSPNETRTI